MARVALQTEEEKLEYLIAENFRLQEALKAMSVLLQFYLAMVSKKE